jgi:hypothetical protein
MQKFNKLPFVMYVLYLEILSLSTEAVTGALSYRKAASVKNLRVCFATAVQHALLHRRVSECQPPAAE